MSSTSMWLCTEGKEKIDQSQEKKVFLAKIGGKIVTLVGHEIVMK